MALGFIRATYDFDFLIPETHRGLCAELMESLHYTLFAENGPFVQWSAPSGLPAVDIMVVDPDTFRKLQIASRQVTVAGQVLTIPSPENIVALKLHATRQRRSPGSVAKDWEDIIRLIQLHALDLEAPDFRALVLRYGGPQAPAYITERLSRA